ncbi:hypothetical protein MNB_SV-3-50 [hydrothermal vent metagenome]|uniref:Uncharacterized protein n=1 Tax=hydrothermal vent metagenome TaxID=652676 RepID=A0A1W1BN71_9ZZZZ
MLYYYASTSHKLGLARVRRAVALLNCLREKGVDTQLLVNDFRAGLVACELGMKEYITIESILDIDAIAEHGDTIIIDTHEDNSARIEKYCNIFNHVFRFRQNIDDIPYFSEYLLDGVVVDRFYEEAQKREKVSRKLFFLNDADYEKNIMQQSMLFEGNGLELLLGNYFFVKYEDELSKIFTYLHESEEYMELIATSQYIVTSSLQTAFEAKTSGACVYYLNLHNEDETQLHYLQFNGIEVVQTIDEIDFEKGCIDTSFNQRNYIVEDILQKL